MLVVIIGIITPALGLLLPSSFGVASDDIPPFFEGRGFPHLPPPPQLYIQVKLEIVELADEKNILVVTRVEVSFSVRFVRNN